MSLSSEFRLAAVAGESAASYMEERKAWRDAGGPGSLVPFVVAGGCCASRVIALAVADVSPNEGVMGGGRTGRLVRGDDDDVVVEAADGDVPRRRGTAVAATFVVSPSSCGEACGSGTKACVCFASIRGADVAKFSLLTISGEAGEGAVAVTGSAARGGTVVGGTDAVGGIDVIEDSSTF
jgi:hypothetical protein